jgi:hypothetical protein
LQYWLEYRYAWRPLVHDVQDAVQALETSFDRMSVKSGGATVNQNLSASKTTIIAIPGGSASVSDLLSGSRTYRGKAYAKPDGNRVTVGFDPLVTAWELIPYSFVVDWFLHVGGWIQSVSPFSGATLLGSQYSIKDVYTMTQETSLTWSTAGHLGSDSGRKTVIEVERYTRVPTGGSIVPLWNPKVTVTRIVDLIALILQGRSKVARVLKP